MFEHRLRRVIVPWLVNLMALLVRQSITSAMRTKSPHTDAGSSGGRGHLDVQPPGRHQYCQRLTASVSRHGRGERAWIRSPPQPRFAGFENLSSRVCRRRAARRSCRGCSSAFHPDTALQDEHQPADPGAGSCAQFVAMLTSRALFAPARRALRRQPRVRACHVPQMPR